MLSRPYDVGGVSGGKDAACIFWENHIEGPADSKQGHAICSGETATDMLLDPGRHPF